MVSIAKPRIIDLRRNVHKTGHSKAWRIRQQSKELTQVRRAVTVALQAVANAQNAEDLGDAMIH